MQVRRDQASPNLPSHFGTICNRLCILQLTLLRVFEKQKQNDSFIIWLGYYIEHLSRINFMKAQEYVDMVLEKMRMKGERKFALAHLINTIKNSDELSDEFFDKVYPQILKHLKNQDKEKLIPHFIRLLTNDQKVTLYGDGKNIRDWLYVEDHCDAIWAIFNNGKS